MAKHALEASQAQRDAIEGLIDQIGLSGVLDAIYDICDEKAQHIRASYSDEPLAKLWERAAWTARKASDAAEV